MHQQDMQLTTILVYLHLFTHSLCGRLYIHRSLRASSSCSCSSSGPVAMARERLMLAVVAALLCQSLAIHAMSAGDQFKDQKNFFYKDPHISTTPPTVYYTPPPYGSGGGGGHSNPTPTHGGAPPANCGAPPSGGHHSTPSTPHKSPPRSNPPVTVTPPRTPTVTPPRTPTITVPSPPLPYDPNLPPYTCTYWKNHPTLIWGLFGWWGSVGSAFGATSNVPGFGAKMKLLQALSNTRTDGYGELYREGTAALLNSMAHTKYPYTTAQVKERFAAALSSNKAAAAQASLFKMANEGKTKARL